MSLMTPEPVRFESQDEAAQNEAVNKVTLTKDRGRKSLLWRLFLTFSACVMVAWLAMLVWLVISGLSEGRVQMERELDVFSKQLLPVADLLQDRPDDIRLILSNLTDLEATLDDDDWESLLIEVRIDGEPVFSSTRKLSVAGQVAPPLLVDGFQEFSAFGEDWWSYTSSNVAENVNVRVAGQAFTSAALSMPEQLVTFFLPLVVSLPLLLIPAWFMARFALKPLHETAQLISARVTSGTLEEIPATPYTELNSVVVALNGLLSRLSSQLQRERSLVAEVAHELKTPLAIVQTNQGILQRSTHPQRRDVALQDLGAGVMRCNHLVQQLLGLARLERELDSANVVRDMDLAEFVRLRLAHAESLALKRSVSLDLHAPETLPVTLDVDAFAAALDNLLDNAIKYSPAGGSVRVLLEDDRERDALVLCLADGGPGIAPDDRERVFRRFERLSADRPAEVGGPEGAGLGLAIVQRAVRRLGGALALNYAYPESSTGLKAEISIPREVVTRPVVVIA